MEYPLKNKTIISFSYDCWDGLWQTRQYIMSRLAINNKVLFVSGQFYIWDIIEDIGKRKLAKSGLKKINDNLFSYKPLKFFPLIHKFSFLRKIITYGLVKHIIYLLKKINYNKNDIILYIWRPEFVDMVGKFNEKLLCYHIDDDYAKISGNNKSLILKAIDLMKKADIVFVHSKELMNIKKKYARNIHWIPNGVDFEHYYNIVKSNLIEPSDIKDIKHPRIGYVGRINRKVDFDLIKYIVRERPKWSFIFIGPVNIDNLYDKNIFLNLQREKNVYYLGSKKISELPIYISSLDVCLMCYRVIDWVVYGYPLKMHEYLACGKPIVSANLLAVNEFRNIIKIALTREEWIEYIEDSINENDKELFNKRINIAKNNSWDKRVGDLSNLIHQELEGPLT